MAGDNIIDVNAEKVGEPVTGDQPFELYKYFVSYIFVIGSKLEAKQMQGWGSEIVDADQPILTNQQLVDLQEHLTKLRKVQHLTLVNLTRLM